MVAGKAGRGMMRVGIARILILTILISLLMTFPSFADADVYFISDSRGVGLSDVGGWSGGVSGSGGNEERTGEKDGWYYYVRVGAGVGYFEQRLDDVSSALSDSSKTVVIWMGTNDVGGSDTNLAKEMGERYVSTIVSKNPKCKVVFVECGPKVTASSGTDSYRYTHNENIQAFNEGLRESISSASGVNIKLIDMYDFIMDKDDGTISSDGIHYNHATSKAILDRIKSNLGGSSSSSSGGSNSGKSYYDVSDSKSEFAEALRAWMEKQDITEGDLYNWSSVICALRSDGINDTGIAAVLGNLKRECAGGIFTIEGYDGIACSSGETFVDFKLGNTYDYGDTKGKVTNASKGKIYGMGIGIVQWTAERNKKFSEFSDSHFSEYSGVHAKHWRFCDYISGYETESKVEVCMSSMPGQVEFMLTELHEGYSSARDVIVDASDTDSATAAFHDAYLKSDDDTMSTRQKYAKDAVPMVEACTGVEGVSPDGSAVGNGETDAMNTAVGENLYEAGIWDERDLSTWNRLVEIDVESEIAGFTIDDFDSSDLTGFTAWKRNIDNDLEQNSLIAWIRRIVALFGILFTVWVIIVYICYWFDRINSIFFIDALGIVTFGHLHASVDGESSFRETKATKGGGKTVNHRDILFICIVGIAFGVLIISGYYYVVIQRIIYCVRWLLSKLGGA